MNTIGPFREEYFYLSNFYPCGIEYEGLLFKSSEALFQSFKTNDRNIKIYFSKLTPVQAKRYGKRVDLIDNWDQIRIEVMYKTLTLKFTQNEDLKEKLISTGNRVLVEDNNYGDTFWGVCNDKGKNYLGQLLMLVRQELREENNYK